MRLILFVQGELYRLPTVLMMPVEKRNNTGEGLESLLGVCLQSILEKHGSGLEGVQLTEDVNHILAMVRQLQTIANP